MSDQLRENGSAGIHPPLFRRRGVQPFSFLTAVFSSNRLGAATLERRPSTHKFNRLSPIGLSSAIA
jgi:hypothetical protein